MRQQPERQEPLGSATNTNGVPLAQKTKTTKTFHKNLTEVNLRRESGENESRKKVESKLSEEQLKAQEYLKRINGLSRPFRRRPHADRIPATLSRPRRFSF